jgi:hypothetical protein
VLSFVLGSRLACSRGFLSFFLSALIPVLALLWDPRTATHRACLLAGACGRPCSLWDLPIWGFYLFVLALPCFCSSLSPSCRGGDLLVLDNLQFYPACYCYTHCSVLGLCTPCSDSALRARTLCAVLPSGRPSVLIPVITVEGSLDVGHGRNERGLIARNTIPLQAYSILSQRMGIDPTAMYAGRASIRGCPEYHPHPFEDPGRGRDVLCS